MVLTRFITIALSALFAVPVAAAPTDFEINIASGLQSPLSPRICKCEVQTLEAKPADWIKAFQNLADQFTELVGPTRALTAENAFFVVAGEGPFPVILEKVTAVINDGGKFLDQLADSEPLKKGDDTDSVYEAYTAATKAAIFWANVLVSKSNDFKVFGFAGRPIGALGEAALRGVLEVYDSFAFLVTDFIPDRLVDIQGQAYALNNGFGLAINSYSGIKLGLV